MDSQIYKVLNCLNEGLPSSNFCIAGGSVRDYIMGRTPKDYDVFIFDEEIPEKFLERFPDITVETHQYEKYLIKNSILNLETGEGQLDFKNPLTGLEVRMQIMHIPMRLNSREDCINQLLDSFDWNVSLFAMDPKRVVYKREDTENIKPGEYLKLQSLANPLSTLFRGRRFCDRFQMKMRNRDIVALCQAVVDRQIRPEYKPLK